MAAEIITAIIGAIATILSALVTRFVLRKYFPERSILPTKRKEREAGGEEYSNLAGDWEQYHLTRDTSISLAPFWAHHKEHLDIYEGQYVEGFSKSVDHPAGLEYRIKGQIRQGKMILTLDCVSDPTEFATHAYPNLLNRKLLVGNWTGFDFQKRPVTGALISSREQRTAGDLNEILKTSEGWSYIPGDAHPLEAELLK